MTDFCGNGTGIALTFDIDWCDDGVLAKTIERVEKADVRATFFVTHDTPLLARMRENPNIELGIHPNFNKLLSGEHGLPEGGFRAVLESLKALVPEAESTRSHALTTNSVILSALKDYGIRRDVNWYIPLTSGMGLKPYYHIDRQLIRIPFFFEDDAHCAELDSGFPHDWEPARWLTAPDMPYRVFNFHPIHLFLNSETMARYEAARPFFHDMEGLGGQVNAVGPGAAAFFEGVISEGKRMGLPFLRVKDIQIPS